MQIHLTITNLQAQGIKDRQKLVEAHQRALAEVTDRLNQFLSGIVSGHGYDRVRVLNLDDASLVLTIEVPDIEPSPAAGGLSEPPPPAF